MKKPISRNNSQPMRMRGKERRVQLLVAARTIIRRDGINSLTMTALADEVGISKPVVYKHFKNSEDVVIEILKSYTQGSITAASQRVKDARTLYEFLDKVIESLFDYIREEGPIMRSITTGFSSSENIDSYFQKQKAQTHRIYTHLLEQQGVPQREASVAAFALMEMISMTIHECAQQNGRLAMSVLKKLVRGALGSLIDGEGKVRPSVPSALFDKSITGL